MSRPSVTLHVRVEARALLAREVAADVLGAWREPGIEQWVSTGEGKHVARRWREILTEAASRVEIRLVGRLRGEASPLPPAPPQVVTPGREAFVAS